jgi:hypothetical protein
MSVDEVIEIFNEGQFYDELEPYFNDVMTFLKYVKKYDRLNDLDLGMISPRDIDDELIKFMEDNNIFENMDYESTTDDLKNILLLAQIKKDQDKTFKYIVDTLLTDVEIRDGGYYLRLRGREELSEFFCGGGNRNRYSARQVAEQILSEEGLDYVYYDSNTKPYETVTELDDTNLAKLKDIIYKEVGNVELSLEDYDSDYFEGLSEEQGTEGYFRITPESLNTLLKDTDATNELFSNDLDEIGSELKNLYWNSENNAYENEIYDLVMGGLNQYFDGPILEEPKKIGENTRYIPYVKIRDFIGDVSSFIQSNRGSSYADSVLEYYGDYSSMMISLFNEDIQECIDFRIPEYPDWSRTTKNINEMFNDYI